MLIHRSISILPTFITLILFTSSSSASSITEKTSAYDVLQSYNFPIGILPQGILDYNLDNSSGKFSASWNNTCSFSLEGSYQLKYKSTIRGYLSNSHLSKLEGVSVKLLFFWADIVDVLRKGDDLEFSVGIASAGFSIDNFEECPQCGCGLNCDNNNNNNNNNNGVVGKIRRSPLISSY